MSPRIVFIYAFKPHHRNNLNIVMDSQPQLIKTSIFHIPETNKLLPVTDFLFFTSGGFVRRILKKLKNLRIFKYILS